MNPGVYGKMHNIMLILLLLTACVYAPPMHKPLPPYESHFMQRLRVRQALRINRQETLRLVSSRYSLDPVSPTGPLARPVFWGCVVNSHLGLVILPRFRDCAFDIETGAQGRFFTKNQKKLGPLDILMNDLIKTRTGVEVRRFSPLDCPVNAHQGDDQGHRR